MIRTLIVEDSPTAQMLLRHILDSDEEITVVGAVADGEEALKYLETRAVDVITMDLNMPKMDGYTATRTIMETRPVPIVVVSATLDPREVQKAWKAIDSGAVAALRKPRGIGSEDYQKDAEKIVNTVKLMSQVKVVRRWARRDDTTSVPSVREIAIAPSRKTIRAVAIGASTGGPPVLKSLLAPLPPSFAAPVLVVQHITPGFTEGFVKWLNESIAMDVRLARDNEPALPGTVYVAPDEFHIKLGWDGKIEVTSDEPENWLRPSVSYLFRSMADNLGRKAVGIVLTGMGRDGAEELKRMREAGAVTVAQDRATSIVYGMPGEAERLDAAEHILPPEKISKLLLELVGRRRDRLSVS